MCPPWIPWIPCSCGLVVVLPILAHTLVMSSVWSGPSSARVWLIYCLCNLPFNVVRNPGTTPVDSTRMSRRSTVDQGVQRQRFSDANASNDNTSARARDESLRRATVSCHLTLSQLLLSGDPFPGCEQPSPADDALSLSWTTTPIPKFVQPFYQHQPRRTSALYARFSFRSSSPINSTVQSMTSRYSRTLTTPVC